MMRSAQPLPQTAAEQPARLISIVEAVVPGAVEHCTEVPEVPTRLWDRNELSRIFAKHKDTIHAWEQYGWLEAVRKPSGRIRGYPADQVAAVAARLFKRFPNASFNQPEAERLQLSALLYWVHRVVHSTVAFHTASKEAVLDVLSLAALAGTAEGIAETHNVSDDDLDDHRDAAVSQLRARLRDPYARHLLLTAWRQAGVVLRVRKLQTPSTQ